jgi:hypothetical protein
VDVQYNLKGISQGNLEGYIGRVVDTPALSVSPFSTTPEESSFPVMHCIATSSFLHFPPIGKDTFLMFTFKYSPAEYYVQSRKT